MTDREIEEYKRQLADIETARELLLRVIRNTTHEGVREKLSQCVYPVTSANMYLRNTLQDLL